MSIILATQAADQEDCSEGLAKKNSLRDPILKIPNTKTKKGEGSGSNNTVPA
jgi:hypothetical protein